MLSCNRWALFAPKAAEWPKTSGERELFQKHATADMTGCNGSSLRTRRGGAQDPQSGEALSKGLRGGRTVNCVNVGVRCAGEEVALDSPGTSALPKSVA